MTSPCRRSTTLLEPFVDGELSSDKVVEVEEHIAECNTCRERVRLSNAMRTSLRDVVRVTYVLPDAGEFKECWPILRKYFGEVRPAAMMISAGLADSRMRIEIEVTARRQAGS